MTAERRLIVRSVATKAAGVGFSSSQPDTLNPVQQGRASRTSEWVAAIRAIYSHVPVPLEVAWDPVAEQLLPATLRRMTRGVSATPWLARGTHRVLGLATRGVSYTVALRTRAIDDALRRALDAGVRQLVVLGAGLDARAWRLPELERTTVFELDHPATGADKRRRVSSLEPLAGRVEFAAIDFETERIDDVLSAAGFEIAQPSFWIWEGVTMYLPRVATEASLAAISRCAAPGSGFAITYIRDDYAPRWQRAFAERVGRLIGEPLKGTLPTSDCTRCSRPTGFSVVSDESLPRVVASLLAPSGTRTRATAGAPRGRRARGVTRIGCDREGRGSGPRKLYSPGSRIS